MVQAGNDDDGDDDDDDDDDVANVTAYPLLQSPYL